MKTHINQKSAFLKKGVGLSLVAVFVFAILFCFCSTNLVFGTELSYQENNALVSNKDVTITGTVYKDNTAADVKLPRQDKQIVYTNGNKIGEGVYPACAGAKIYLNEENEAKATADELGKFSFSIAQYSKGALHAEWNDEETNTLYKSDYYYFNFEDTVVDYNCDILINPYIFQRLYEHYAVVNHVYEYEHASDIPSGTISSYATCNGDPYEEWLYKKENVTSVPILWDYISRSTPLLGSNSLSSPMNIEGAKIEIDDNTGVLKIKYSETVVENNTNYYVQTLTPNPQPGYDFDGWYHFRYNEDNGTQFAYEKCHDGDFIHSYYDNYGFAAQEEALSSNDDKPWFSDGGKIGLVARFVFNYNNAPHKINVKVDDESRANNYGYFCGSNGNSSVTNATSYLMDFSFHTCDNSNYSNGTGFYTYGSIGYSNVLAFGEDYGYDEDWPLNSYELGWVNHTTYTETAKLGTQNGYFEGLPQSMFCFIPKAMPGCAFVGWDILDSKQHHVEIDSGYFNVEDDLTCIAKFAPALKLSGTISDSEENLVPNANVSFASANGYNIFNAQSDGNGNYSIDATSDGGTLTVWKNGYYTETSTLRADDVEAGTYNVSLSKPKNPVYLCGKTYFETQNQESGAALSNRTASGTTTFHNLVRCTLVFYDETNNKISTYYEYDQNNERFSDNPATYNVGQNYYEIPIEKGAEGSLFISCNGFETLIATIDSDITSVDVDSYIDLASVGPDVDETFNGYFIEKNIATGEDIGKTVLAWDSCMNVYVSTEDNEKGQLQVNYNDGGTAKVDYTAGMNFLYGDKFYIDYETGKFTIKRGADTLLECVPVPAEDNYFFGWVGYTDYGQRLELMSNGTIVDNLTVYAQFKPGAMLNAKGDSEGHNNYKITFNSNELSHVGIYEPITVTDESFALRQYKGTTYTVSGNKITFTFDESQENPNPDIGAVYIETTELVANAKDGYTFDHWKINGDDVESGKTGKITSTDVFDVQAIYTGGDDPGPWPPWPPFPPGPWPPYPPGPVPPGPVPPIPPDPPGPVPPEPVPPQPTPVPVPTPVIDDGGGTSAQTSDAVPIAVLGAFVVLAALGAMALGSRKIINKL